MGRTLDANRVLAGSACGKRQRARPLNSVVSWHSKQLRDFRLMGMWGAGLYEDDAASDLREAVALVAKIPVNGDRLLAILRDMNGDIDPNDIDGQTFWLVLADQFERRGIACSEVTSAALSIIAHGQNMATLRELGADESTLKKRGKVLGDLSARLASPRPLKLRVTPKKPPDVFLSAGEIYSFPAMNGIAARPWRAPHEGPFVPNGWGALVVLETGRAFDWLPWCGVASLSINPTHKPALDDALTERLIFHMQTEGAARCIPRRSELRKMSLELLGRVALDPLKVEPVLSKWGVPMAIEFGWSVSYAGYTRDVKGPVLGGYLSSLVMNAT